MNAKEVKILSEKKIEKLQLEQNRDLPIIEELEELRFKPAQEIAKRILVLAYLIAIDFGIKRKVIRGYLKTYGLYESLSINEEKLLNKFFLRKQDKIDVGWYSEAIEILGWCLGLWETDPLNFADEDKQAEIVPIKRDPSEFIKKAGLIDRKRIYAEADFIFRLYWIAKRGPVGKIGENAGDVFSERQKAINWVIGVNENWDESG